MRSGPDAAGRSAPAANRSVRNTKLGGQAMRNSQMTGNANSGQRLRPMH